MRFDEEDLRRALEARSAPPSPQFRGRLSSALSQGRARPDRMPALAAVAAVLMALTVVGVFALVRAAGTERVAPLAKPTPSPVASSPSPLPSPTVVAGVLKAPPAPVALPANATLSSPSHNVVWALVVDQYLYRSTDRGTTWQQEPLPPFTGMPEISFVSDTEGWLSVVGSPETQCNAQSIQIWRTTDAGTTWQLLGSRGIDDRLCKSGLSFVDSTHGFLGSWGPDGRPVIYFTTDGGLTWHAAAPLSDPPGFVSQPGGDYFAAGRVRSFGGALMLPIHAWSEGTPRQFVYVSNDGGRNWGYNATVPNGNGSLALVSATYWLQLIFPGQSMETTDGGATWHVSTSDYSQAAGVAPEVTFADGEVGYATVRGGIQRTTDGGRHWTTIRTPGT